MSNSAEVIVVVEYELRIDTAEVSQINEGLNVKQQQILHGGQASRRKALQEKEKGKTLEVCNLLTKF